MPRFIIAAAVLLTLFLSTPAFSQSTNAIREHPGSCIGYASCYVAALVQRLATERQKADLGGALAKSVHAARVLHLAGYADGDADTLADLRFPVRKVVDALSAPEIPLSTIGLADLDEGWTILHRHRPLDIKAVSANVVRTGAEASLANIPLERIGNWESVDRTEIESIRSLRNLMAEYVAQPRPVRPLSLAVFGPARGAEATREKVVANRD